MVVLLAGQSYAFEPWYNITNFTDEDEFVGMAHVANDYTFGIFGIAIYLGFFILLMFVFQSYGASKAVAGASFIAALVGLVMTPLNIINPWLVMVMMFIAILSFVGLFFET